MRKLTLGLSISAAVHLVLAVGVSAVDRIEAVPAVVAEPTPIEIVPAAPPPEPPLDVVLFEAATSAPVPAPPRDEPTRRLPRPPSPAKVEAGRARGVEAAGTVSRGTEEPGTTPPPRSGWLDMRKGRADLALPTGFRDGLDRPPAGTVPDRGTPATGQLMPSGGGTHRSDHGVFVANVARDGSVSFKNGRNLRIGSLLPTPRKIGEGIASWYESDKGPGGKQIGGSTDAGDRSRTAVVPVAGGSFDVTDWLMRRNKNDPYASRKLAFLDATRDERVQLGKRHRQQQLQQTARMVQRNLDRMWRQLPDPAARKQALFELWDEIVDGGEGDELLGEASLAARKQVIGFIRGRLPVGSAHAFTAGEITALNRSRRSQMAFAPYED